MKGWIKIIVAILLTMAALGAVVIWQRQQSEEPARTVTAERTSLKKEIAFTGRLEAAEKAELGFTAPGTITEVLVEEGRSVIEGEKLVRLDSRSEALQIAEARAARASTQEEARLALQQALDTAENTEAENNRLLEEKRQRVRDAKNELDQTKEVWQQKVRESGEDSSAAESAYAAVLTAETAYHGAQQALLTTQKTVAKQNETAVQAAESAQTQYTATTQASGNVAGLSALQAREHLAQVALSKNIITAPFAGVVTSLNASVGELAPAGTPIVTIQTVTNLEITAEVLESDVAAMAVGMPASVTFDALPATEIFQAHVSYIAPAAQLVEGVPTYKVTLTVESADLRLRPGLTTNVIVQAEEKDNVIAIPRRAVFIRDGREYVRVKTGEESEEERAVVTGLTGGNGLVEIVSGLQGGEEVITSNSVNTQ